jgi:hypothetical protein
VSKQPTPQVSQPASKQVSKQPTPQASQHASPRASKQPTPQVSHYSTPQLTPRGSKQPTPQASRRNSEIKLDQITEDPFEQIGEEQPIEEQSGRKRTRKDDRRTLASDLGSELPISLRYNENVNIDNKDEISDYSEEWRIWIPKDDEEKVDKIQELLELLDYLEEKYNKSSKLNTKMGKSIQFALLILGSGIVYVQASGASAELIQKWNIAGGAATTICTMVYNFFGFAKKGPHFGNVASNLKKLKCWIESKLILPEEKRYSPFDIYTIATKALQVILEEAQQGKQDSK